MQLLENLKLTSKLVSENISAQRELETIKIQNNKTQIVNWYFALGLIIGILAVALLFTALYMVINTYGLVSSEVIRDHGPLISLISMITLSSSLLLIVILFKKLGHRHRERIVRNRFEKNYSQIQALNDSINHSYSRCEEITVLPKKYWNTESIEMLREYIENKRADSLKEALNLFEDELHKKQQMQMLRGISSMQNQMVRAQLQTNREIAWQSFLISMKR